MARQADGQAKILRYMWSAGNQGVSVRDISEATDMPPATLGRVLRNLEAQELAHRSKGHITQRIHAHNALDDAATLVRTPDTWFLTDKGLKVADELAVTDA